MYVKRLISTLAAFAAVFCTTAVAFADEAGGVGGGGHSAGVMAMAIGIGIGLAVLGGALGQSRAAAAALEGIARNPNASDKVFVPMILGLSFIESLVLFAWVLMFMLLNKI